MIRIAASFLLAYALAAPASAAPQVAGPAQVRVDVWNFGFAPRPIRLAAGRPVTMTFVNRSGASHDFTAPAFFQHSRISAGAAPGGEIELGPHEARTITLTPAAGAYRAHCTHFLHKQMGMSDLILVD